MYHLFEKYGIELEYMIVDRADERVCPVTDRVIKSASGSIQNEICNGDISWSNELVLHVIELKTTSPVPTVAGIDKSFQSNVNQINNLLEKFNARLMPGPMHPFMDPVREMRLWPHDYNPIYEAFDRIFSCKGHGWANLQSMHINLPFANDEEFGRLHAAIRMILPIIPALSAASPIADGLLTGYMDTRMDVYRKNSSKIPSITGSVIPEPVYSPAQYQEKILNKIYRDLAPFDPEGILQEEWVNARGAIARFERNTIEIRVIDVQEAPVADISIAALIIEAVRMMVEERVCSYQEQKKWETEPLAVIFSDTVKSAEHTWITDEKYLKCFGIHEKTCQALHIWNHLFTMMQNSELVSKYSQNLRTILDEGTLASRILRALGETQNHPKIREVYRKLSSCLQEGVLFTR